ncbi:MAG: type IV toxin-antitoxin system AbiEi family antitoxin domain-containing protein [Patescibacteria group bacterium]
MYRIDTLLKLDKKLYHTNDLAICWSIFNKNTLYTTIKRYVKKGVLIPVRKGIYSTVPLTQLRPLDLGVALAHRYAYLSTESVLVQNGIISQNVYYTTFVSSFSNRIGVGGQQFLYRKLKDKFLFNPEGVESNNGVLVATTERAVADMLYFDPKYHFDFFENIDFNKVKDLQKKVGYPC